LNKIRREFPVTWRDTLMVFGKKGVQLAGEPSKGKKKIRQKDTDWVLPTWAGVASV